MKNLKKAALAVGLMAVLAGSSSLLGYSVYVKVIGKERPYRVDDLLDSTRGAEVKKEMYKRLEEENYYKLKEFPDPLQWELIVAGIEVENDKILGFYRVKGNHTIILKLAKAKKFLKVKEGKTYEAKFYDDKEGKIVIKLVP